ncbi:MAG: presqualene diphosphate synthase HpnD [Candidatus Binatia bacterium]
MDTPVELSPRVSHLMPLSLADSYAYCRQITRKSSSNFYYAFHLLPFERHNALCALYAFCRFLDDITDQPEVIGAQVVQGSGKKERVAALLHAWREELQRCYEGTPQHPISRALADTVQRFPIQQQDLAGIIDGVEMDLSRTRYQTFAELYDYCYHVASLVGLACIEIFGYRKLSAREYAVNLGIAFQLTNILRDVGEDAQRDRIYLPQEDLKRFGYSEEQLRSGDYNDAFVHLMVFEGERARAYYAKAVNHLSGEDQRTLAAAEAMRLIYSRLLDELADRQFNVFKTRITLPPVSKACLAAQAWARGWFGLFPKTFLSRVDKLRYP